MFRPRSVAVIGASPRPESVGNRVLRNLLDGGFDGPVWPINPKHESIEGVPAFATVADLPEGPDLAAICTPAATVPGLIAELGACGSRAAVVLTAGLSNPGPDGRPLSAGMLDAARPHLLRILGPNCVGLLVPGLGLNASFAHANAIPGDLAFVSQSGGMCTAVLDWANSRGIGFSHFISLGNGTDVDIGDLIDYLANDPATKAILLYIEAVTGARKFMSAARAASRAKPVVAIKAGRVAEGARAAASHTGALAGADDVYDAAFNRAGILRVHEFDELFDAVETLGRARPVRGEALAILTNGGGPGVLATDALVLGGGRLAELSAGTIDALDGTLPGTWSRGNPVDIIGDATADRYADALDIVLDDDGVDALLLIHVPVAVVNSADIAERLVARVVETKKPVVTSWVGGESVSRARSIFEEAGLACYDTPERAVGAFLHSVRYRHALDQLMETPPETPPGFSADTDAVTRIIADPNGDEDRVLSEPDAKAVLAAYGIPVVETRTVATPDDAVSTAVELGFPVALKVLSPDISHKSDVGGVVLDLGSEDEVRRAAGAMAARVAELRPDARIDGYTVQKMERRPDAHEVIVGAASDATFGPVVLFGQGGKAVEVVADRAVALPPLNMLLARRLIGQTRVAKLLEGYRDRPAADIDAICLTLVRISQLVSDVAEIAEIDINPLLVDHNGVVALDARIRVVPTAAAPADRLSIRPYPAHLEESIELGAREVLLRPIRPEDEPQHRAFLDAVHPDDKYLRFFGFVRLTHHGLARLTQIDYDREMAFIASAPAPGGGTETLGVVRAVTDPDNEVAEFAILIRSDQKGRGLGRTLMNKIIAYCRGRGTSLIRGLVLPQNTGMMRLARGLGFDAKRSEEDDAYEITLRLT